MRPGRLRTALGVQLAVCPVLALHALGAAGNGLAPSGRGLAADWLVSSLLGCALICWQRRPLPALLSWGAALVLLFGAAHMKLAILGDWPRWSDLALLPETLVVVPVTTTGLVAGALIGLVATIASNLRRPTGPGLALGTLLLSAASLAILRPEGTRSVLDGLFPWHAWVGNDPFSRGLFVSLARDAAQSRIAARMLRGLEPLPLARASGAHPSRNLHIVVAESLTDPRDLGPGFPRGSFDPRLMSWSRGRALSPNAGSGSAQSEFELLCGLPATAALPDAVVFNGLGGRAVPCLPRRLAARGYRTAASVAVEPWFFNARRAYQSLGFQATHFSDDLPPGARRGGANPTRGLMRHNRSQVEGWLAAGRPFLNYVVTVEPHFPFREPGAPPLAGARSPERSGLASGLRTATRAIADHVEWLLQRDPQALVVIVGDHQAPGFSGRPRSPSQLFRRLGVPLAILDAGEPRAAGVVAHFELPGLLMAGLEGASIRPRTSWLRPLREGRALYSGKGELRACPAPGDTGCTQVQADVVALEARTQRLVAMSRWCRSRNRRPDRGISVSGRDGDRSLQAERVDPRRGRNSLIGQSFASARATRRQACHLWHAAC